MSETGKLSSLFIAGAPKSGTTSVFYWLADHPQTQASTPKETCFFADPDSHVFRPQFNNSLGPELYKTAFPNPDDTTRMRLDGSASYIFSRTALKLIPDLPGQPKCLFLLREPASQILSTYTYFRNNWAVIPEGMSFVDYLAALRAGTHDFAGNELARDALHHARYAPWLLRWRDRLGGERMKVCTFDELKGDPKGFITDLAKWCGLNPTFYDSYPFNVENESYVPVNRSLQRLNIALRGRLPKGRVYDAIRRLYRRTNTRTPDRPTDPAVMASLRADFAGANDQLAQEFGLDLTSWAP